MNICHNFTPFFFQNRGGTTAQPVFLLAKYQYPFIELVYELIDKVGFIITEEAINADTNFYEAIGKIYGKEAVFNLEKLIYIMEK